IALAIARPAAPSSNPDEPRTTEIGSAPGSLCDDPDFRRWIELTPSSLDSLSRNAAARNFAVVSRADSLLQAGMYGDPESEEARSLARLYVQLRSWNAMDSILEMASGPGMAWVQRDLDFTGVVQEFSNLAMYPMRHIAKARVGDGAFCIRYDIPAKFDQVMVFGDSKIRIRNANLELESGEKVPVWSREWLAGDGKKLELLFEETFCGHIGRETVMDDGDEIEILFFYDLHGVHVRRHGVHHLNAMVTWRNVLQGDELPGRPRIGAAAYFPKIKIELPIFLPDLGLDDLREFPYPPPIFRSRLFQEPKQSFPDWLRANRRGEFENWPSLGPRPGILDERFPDL
ncbi:MAG: hypothetical protein KC729_13985, partial [Candidatus Eisenbacteria bacterium]|nr:hypothetical protein [Candidatus Eisenbacteria bacterium]